MRALVTEGHAEHLHVPVAGRQRRRAGRRDDTRLPVEDLEDARTRGGRALREPERHAE